mmetsp:Transcript_1706/g.3711  ORF Transcript_1706/g.3711 Transcript_1706/m.3711 type:complete len:1053 (-) Transcript_1706:124-3282(-)|eukprot:scaffold1803_cov92-Amphora_coffeaeformis.AAC.66
MPTDEALLEQTAEWKVKGNDAFAKGQTDDAVAAYSQGIVLCDRVVAPMAADVIKATLLSNRAMCHLKAMRLDRCQEDCTTGLALNIQDAKLRNKLLFRRAKAGFLRANLPAASADLLPEAAKDLMQILNTDKTNKDATQLLTMVRATHRQNQKATTPVSQTLEALQGATETADQLKQVKILLGLLNNDAVHAPMELGRLQGVGVLLQLAQQCSSDLKTSLLSLQALSQSATNPNFCREYLVPKQKDLNAVIQAVPTPDPDWFVSALAIWVRIILHADRDDPDTNVTVDTLLDYDAIVGTVQKGLEQSSTTVLRGVMDLVGVWTAGTDRDAIIRQSLADGNMKDPTLPKLYDKMEIHAFTPKQYAAYQKRKLDLSARDGTWAQDRCKRLVSDPTVFSQLLASASGIDDSTVRREMTVTVGRLLAILEEDDAIKDVVKTYLASESDLEGNKKGVTIETINENEEQKEGIIEEEVSSLSVMMKRAIITSGLLMSRKEVGSWALAFGWVKSGDELPALINSGDKRAMGLASEVVSAAATVENSRPLLTNMIDSGVMSTLLLCDDRDIKSSAASAVAKLGLSSKETQKDDGEMMGLLQAACDLLEDDKAEESKVQGRQFSSYATSSVERAVEMINYLIAKTDVKEELAAGFKPRYNSELTALERLVKTASLPDAGESLTGFALATIFQNMAVTNIQLRRESFEGREMTMEQYDEMQKLGKTAEEQDVLDAQQDPDTPAACHERIRKMAAANVPRAMISLMEGASEQTLGQIILGFCRMADEISVRGLMIQQGVLSALVKIEKIDTPTDTDGLKKVTRNARHCIGKLLISTNPALLTSAQRLGAIKPLIQLLRDTASNDLQKFEVLLSITNLASSGEDALDRIVSEKGIPTLHFCMFSQHEMVRRAATEAMSNLIQHQKMIDHLLADNNLKLWLNFAADYEEHYECARAAAGCLAMATQLPTIAQAIVKLDKFQEEMECLLESGRLEIMHRGFVLLENLVEHGDSTKEAAIKTGLVAFCDAYAQNCQATKDLLDFPEEERALLPVTEDIAKKIVRSAA